MLLGHVLSLDVVVTWVCPLYENSLSCKGNICALFVSVFYFLEA